MRTLSAGTSLIEVLVALLVLSIAMLGIAQMFITSLRHSRGALLRTQAVNLASDLADRIRANASARGAYELAGYAGGPRERGCAPDATGDGSGCSNAELAEDDLARWQRAVETLLPASPAGFPATNVEHLPGSPDRYRIIVAWMEPGEEEASSFQTEIATAGVP